MSANDKALVDSWLSKHSITLCPSSHAVGISRLEIAHSVPPSQGMRQSIRDDVEKAMARRRAGKTS